jgi:hypothetical protein
MVTKGDEYEYTKHNPGSNIRIQYGLNKSVYGMSSPFSVYHTMHLCITMVEATLFYVEVASSFS